MNVPKDQHRIRIEVSDFGPIAEAEFDLRPLTVFIGPSNTGKSYLAVLVYALHKFFSGVSNDSGIGAPLFRRESTFSPFYYANSMSHSTNSQRDAEILLDWIQQLNTQRTSRRQGDNLPERVAALIRPQLRPDNFWSDMIASEIARCFGSADAHWLVRHGSTSGARFSVSHVASNHRSEYTPLSFDFTLKNNMVRATGKVSDAHPLRIDDDFSNSLRRNFRFFRHFPEDDPARQSQLRQSVIKEIAANVGSSMVSPLSHAAHYLPADRTGVMHAHQVVVASMIAGASTAGLRPHAPLPNLSGVLSDFLIQLLSLGRLETNPPRVHRNNLGANIERQMLAGSIQVDRSNPVYPVFTYLPNGWKDHLPLMNSSSMVSELAPVVLYLRHVVAPGNVLIIEEPESNLHPAMQVELVRQLARAVNSGVRVMLTTHSEWVLEELANLVRLSHLEREKRRGSWRDAPALDEGDVGVWRFEKEYEQGGSRVREIKLDLEEGGFASGYDQVARLTYNEWAAISNLIEGAGSP